jgi:hypothetical protein
VNPTTTNDRAAADPVFDAARQATVTPDDTPERVTVQGFTWQRHDLGEGDRKSEHWELVDDVALIGWRWGVTNYGGDHTRMDTPWVGWRYGSGGPFGGDRAKYATRDEAMRACVPYMLERMRSRIVHARQELARVERVHAAALAAHEASKKGQSC